MLNYLSQQRYEIHISPGQCLVSVRSLILHKNCSNPMGCTETPFLSPRHFPCFPSSCERAWNVGSLSFLELTNSSDGSSSCYVVHHVGYDTEREEEPQGSNRPILWFVLCLSALLSEYKLPFTCSKSYSTVLPIAIIPPNTI